MSKWWMVRAGDYNELIPKWQTQHIASIGWPELGDPAAFSAKEKMMAKANQAYKDEKPGTRLSWVGQVWRFYREIGVGDRVITYSKETREYMIGTVTKAHQHRTDIDPYYPNVICVDWESKRVSRDHLSQGAKNSLGGILTVFRVDDWGQELQGLLGGTVIPQPVDHDEQDEISYQDFIEQAKTMVEDLVDQLDPWQMQDLVGGLLQAMGYQVAISPKGPDGGVDILAHRDAFGFEKPIIKVQVKHRHASSGGPEVQQLLGANPHGASCLFVSTGGFTAAARSSALHNGVKLLDLSGIVELINDWYDKMPVEKQALIPLKRIYVPS
ncbi:restriction endonuclease [Paenibacillus athensensis]|uniref:Restriction endonuclease n=1 Tax=Paenibacillus athensensis TaxID=1967502 RepID=A0A4Y8PUB1_9BACL|nr:restriction endonuclease [Paenibacillus athensensis]MCD1258009.1 restriction endonuclease [Paenibacillus athensensis]